MFLRKNNPDAPALPAATGRRRFVKPAALTALVLLIAVGAFFGLRANGGDAPKKDAKKAEDTVVLEFTPADVAVVEYKELVRSIAFSGSLSPLVQTTVKSKVSGEVNRVLVREGESVSQGQMMAQIDTIDLQSKLDSQVATFEEAKAKLNIAQKNRENSLQLLRQKFISQNAFDTSDSTFEGAAASVRSAEAQLRMARKALDDATVRAPFAGVVARKLANGGEKVGIDSPLFELVDLARMEIQAPAPASEIPSVKVGQTVTFKVDGFGTRVFDGRVERINPTADPGSRAITLYLSVANQDGALRGGMFAKGSIVLDKTAKSTVVPANAVRDEAGQTYVFAIEGGKITKRAVKLGYSEPVAGLVEVKSGVEQGLAVVAARMTGLKPGTPAIMKAPAQAQEPAKAG